MHVDVNDPETYTWIFQLLDIAYVPSVWVSTVNKAYARDPEKFNATAVVGRYIASMKINQRKEWTWADSERIQKEEFAKQEEALALAKEAEENVRELYEQGAISEAQFKTYASVAEQEKLRPIGASVINAKNSDNVQEDLGIDDPSDQLTKEDKIYLSMKWGKLYQPSDWIALEKKYTEMMDSFDIHDADTIDTLLLICKTSFKMHQALDCGDVESYQKLARVYDQMRKSTKFTAAQNKEDKSDEFDAVGSIVAFCEKEGGFIPRFYVTQPNDDVDLAMDDNRVYLQTLVKNDPTISQKIDDYIKKREAMDEIKADDEKKFQQGEDAVTVSNEDYEKRYKQIEEERLADARILEEDEPS